MPLELTTEPETPPAAGAPRRRRRAIPVSDAQIAEAVAAEREACMKVVDDMLIRVKTLWQYRYLKKIHDAIRARAKESLNGR